VLVAFIPKNIDLLNIGNPCNQSCRQCYAAERGYFEKSLDQEQDLADRIISRYGEDSSFFVYPKELTTNESIIPFASRMGQDYLLTNGTLLTKKPQILEMMLSSGMKRIRITLFPDAEEQNYWNRNTEEEYAAIKKGIALSVKAGLEAETFTPLTSKNFMKLEELYSEAGKLGVSRMNLIRFVPVGNGREIDKRYIMREQELEELLLLTDSLKKKNGPYISFGMSFGPDFFGKSVWNYLGSGNSSSWVKTKTLCPAIDSNYAGISMKSGNIYWCFMLMADENERIGKVTDSGELIINSPVDLKRATLSKKLTGLCSEDSCDYQKDCLGGCRSNAYIMAKLDGKDNPLYSGMDICRTQTKKRMNRKE
jgi:radical SAM protein with 4Fe4S-binding SPASM domain